MAQVIKGIKLRLYPNAQQREQLWQMFGNDRFVWNQMLAMAVNSSIYLINDVLAFTISPWYNKKERERLSIAETAYAKSVGIEE